MTYQVNKNQMADYIKSLDKRRIVVFALVTSVIVSLQTFIEFKLDNNFPFFIIIIVTIVISVAFYIGLRLYNDKLIQLAGGQFFIDNSTIKMIGVDNLSRDFKLDEVAVVHKKSSGTLIVKGNSWTKVNYIRPKRVPYQLGDIDVIFIPKITSNYIDLVDTIKRTTTNALKL